MKNRFLLFLLTGLVAASLIGCGANGADDESTEVEVETVEEPEIVEPHKVLSGSHDLDGNEISTEIYMDGEEHFEMKVNIKANSDEEAAALIGAYCIYLNESVEDMDTLDKASVHTEVSGSGHSFDFTVDKQSKNMSGTNDDGSATDGFPDWLIKTAMTMDLQQKINDMTNNISNAFYDATVVGM